MKLITFITEESTEKSMKSMDESKNEWRNQENNSLKFELKLGELSMRKKPAGIYRGDL
jgi:K+/H+ antiporter YhaU regulatory subunit KhtT